MLWAQCWMPFGVQPCRFIVGFIVSAFLLGIIIELIFLPYEKRTFHIYLDSESTEIVIGLLLFYFAPMAIGITVAILMTR